MLDRDPTLTAVDDELIQAQSEALTGYLARVVRPIVINPGPGTPFKRYKFGSAQVLRIGEHFVLLTAGHNISESGKNHLLGLSMSDEINADDIFWLTGKRRHGWNELAQLTNDSTGESWTASTDIAVMELSATECAKFGFEPLTLGQVLPHQLLAGEFAMLAGYPTQEYDLSRVESGIVTACFVPFATIGAHQAAWSRKWDASVNQVLLYPSHPVRKVVNGQSTMLPLPDPAGFSGCGMWTVHQYDRNGIVGVNVRMVGIDHAHLKPLGMVVGCNMLPVLTLVADVFQETREIIEGEGVVLLPSQLRKAD